MKARKKTSKKNIVVNIENLIGTAVFTTPSDKNTQDQIIKAVSEAMLKAIKDAENLIPQ